MPASGPRSSLLKDETRILSWSDEHTLRLWDVATGQQIGPAMKHDGWVYGAVLTKDETRILSWSDDKTLRLWDVATGQQIGPAMKHDDNVIGAVPGQVVGELGAVLMEAMRIRHQRRRHPPDARGGHPARRRASR